MTRAFATVPSSHRKHKKRPLHTALPALHTVEFPADAALGFFAKLKKNVFGLVATLAVHGPIPIGIIGTIAGLEASGLLSRTEPEIPPYEPVIAAQFVQLGEILDPRHLPNRQVPVQATAPLDSTADGPVEGAANPNAPSLSAEANQAPQRTNERRQDHAEEDMQRVLAQAAAFAEREAQRVREGDPEGIEEGTARTRGEGDIYLGRLTAFFTRGFSVPTTLTPDEVRGLQAVAFVTIGTDLRVTGVRLARASGNVLFDAAIEEHIQRKIAANEVIPPPPEETAVQYLGREVRINFSGRNLR